MSKNLSTWFKNDHLLYIDGDASGVFMYYTEEPQNKVAGMLSMHVDTMVPRLARSYQDVACQMSENKVRDFN